MDLRRVQSHDRHGGELPLQRLRPGEPPVRRLRRLAQDGVQLRVPRQPAGLGGALPVPERAARQLLGHLVQRQQRWRPPRWRAHPARGRAPDVPPLLRRPPDPEPDADLRLDLRARADAVDHGAQGQQADDDPVGAGGPALRRHHGLVVQQRPARRDREPRRPLPARLVRRGRSQDGDDGAGREHVQAGRRADGGGGPDVGGAGWGRPRGTPHQLDRGPGRISRGPCRALALRPRQVT